MVPNGSDSGAIIKYDPESVGWGRMNEEWREIWEFPGYSVSNAGRVRNDRKDTYMTLSATERGIIYVSLNRRGDHFKRSVPVLVAEAFVETAKKLSFDTPINLDGDRENNYADNLVWRPRWYAIEYYRQFRSRPDGINRPILELKTGDVFKSSWQAAISFGLLEREIVRSIVYLTYALPTFQRFRIHG